MTQILNGLVLVSQGAILLEHAVSHSSAVRHLMTTKSGIDRMMKAAIYFMHFDKAPENEADLSLPPVLETFRIVQANIEKKAEFQAARVSLLQGLLMNARYASAELRHESLNKLRAKMRETNKPHPMGTVDELAKKYGKSKSEIRRLKADNLLHTLEEEQTQGD